MDRVSSIFTVVQLSWKCWRVGAVVQSRPIYYDSNRYSLVWVWNGYLKTQIIRSPPEVCKLSVKSGLQTSKSSYPLIQSQIQRPYEIVPSPPGRSGLVTNICRLVSQKISKLYITDNAINMMLSSFKHVGKCNHTLQYPTYFQLSR